MKNNHINYQDWLIKAQEDELSARAVLDKGAPSTGCFLAQQMAEKYLKCLLVFHNKKFPKIHDLIELEKTLTEVAPKVINLHNELNMLSTYYFETRYPGDYPEFTKKECKTAFNSALKIKEFVLASIKKNR